LAALACFTFTFPSWAGEAPTATAAVPRPPLKQRLQEGEICRGAFLGLLAGGPAAQFLAGQGFDYFILDLLVMIETPKGLERADEILSVPGIDGAIIGTGDYSQAIGLAGQPDHPEVWKAADRLISLCRQKTKLVSVPIRRPENVAHWVEGGLNMLTFVDLALISQGIQLNFAPIDQARRGKSERVKP
jgi:2-keto-3-deoxy-L-rhamnonate aldolase RhmA